MKVKNAIDVLKEYDENENVYFVLYTKDDVDLVDESYSEIITDETWNSIVDRLDNIPTGDDFVDIVQDEMGA